MLYRCHWQLLIISVQDHTAHGFAPCIKKTPTYFKNIIDRYDNFILHLLLLIHYIMLCILTWNLIILVFTLDITCCLEEEVQKHKNSLGCTLRYLKYICSLNLMCFTHSFNIFIFTCSPTRNLEIMSVVTMLCSGCWLFCKLQFIKVGIR